MFASHNLELLSIQDRRDRLDGDPPASDQLDEFDVLGRVSLEPPERKESIITELSDAVALWDGLAAGCKVKYRHALRDATSTERRYLVICFECGQLQVRATGEAVSQYAMTPGKGAVANGVLDAESVPHAR
jgi:hypothetical protein